MNAGINPSVVYLGMRGNVIALNRATGEILWKTALTGRDFLNAVLDDDRVFAATRGEVFCLDAGSGEVMWKNSLPGCGFGMITIASASGNGTIAPQALKSRRDQKAATTASMGAIVATS